MKTNQWTLGLAALGLISTAGMLAAEERVNVLGTSVANTVISGYVNTSARWDVGTGNAHVPGFIYNAGKQDGFNLDLVKLSLEKPLGEFGWSAGYKVDLIFGPDASAFGTGPLFPSGESAATTEFGVRQAYVALEVPVGNGIDFKMGVWDSILGYESHDAGNNANYTRSYGTTIEPHTHTGILATYRITDWLWSAVGVADTMGPRVNERAFYYDAESYKTYLASLAVNAPASWGWFGGSALYMGVVNGFNGNSPSTNNQTSFYVGGTMNTPLRGLKVGASYDYLAGHKRNADADGRYANAVAAYASFQATAKLSVHGRAEYATSDIGVKNGFALLTAKKVFATTATVQYDLFANVLSRLELRWDHQADGNGRVYGGTDTAAPGNRRNAVALIGNVIYKF